MNAKVWLLKGCSEDGDGDGYAAAVPHSTGRVPVLKFEYNPQAVEQLELEVDSFDSVLMTSSRSAMALERYASPELKQKLSRVPWFVVGVASQRAVRELIGPHTVVLGAETGCAEQLVGTGMMSALKRVAYLCGNLRKPTMANGLRTSQVEFKEFITYDTVPDLQAAIPANTGKGETRVLCFFSPSGVTAVGGQVTAQDVVIAIGETTNQALVEAGIHVHRVASSPSPAGLAQALALAL
ncbi:hypothetical protein BASA81_001423 [Batrachochytrium salamandrivorans]|nr:hypothetical protein BASA81_001423 [Batrachochytrium salamandrivorans]